METLNTTKTTKLVKCIPVPDKKNSNKYILKIIYPPELKGKIAFSLDLEVKTGLLYECEVVEDRERFCKVLIHKAVDRETFDIVIHRTKYTASHVEYAVKYLDNLDGLVLKKITHLKCTVCGEEEIKEEDIVALKFNKCKGTPIEFCEDEEEVKKIESFLNVIVKYKPRYIEGFLDAVKRAKRRIEANKKATDIVNFVVDLVKDIKIIEKLEEKWSEYLKRNGLYYCPRCKTILSSVKVEAKEYEDCVRWTFERVRFGGDRFDVRVCLEKVTKRIEFKRCPKCSEVVVQSVPITIRDLKSKVEKFLEEKSEIIDVLRKAGFNIFVDYATSIVEQIKPRVDVKIP